MVHFYVEVYPQALYVFCRTRAAECSHRYVCLCSSAYITIPQLWAHAVICCRVWACVISEQSAMESMCSGLRVYIQVIQRSRQGWNFEVPLPLCPWGQYRQDSWELSQLLYIGVSSFRKFLNPLKAIAVFGVSWTFWNILEGSASRYFDRTRGVSTRSAHRTVPWSAKAELQIEYMRSYKRKSNTHSENIVLLLTSHYSFLLFHLSWNAINI
jgi:hypothetical protein